MLTVTFVASCSKDIKVTSDVGEVSVVKESAVTTYLFDKKDALSKTESSTNTWKKALNSCLDGLDFEFCDNLYGKQLRKDKEDVDLINSMPEITIAKYRTIDTNVNGDKSASAYKYVSCIPDGETKMRVKWASLVSKFNKDMSNNLLNDGLVASSLQAQVCEKYGNL